MMELKPCPFCGGEAKLELTTQYYTGEPEMGNAFIRCMKCGVWTDEYVYATEAADAWNTRHEEIVRCRDCSYYEHGIYTFFGERKGEYHCCSRDWNGEPGSSDVEPDGFCSWGERKVEG